MEAEWTRFKRNVHLANAVGPTPEAGAAFRATLRAAVGDSVARCRAERKRARDAETPRDTSDAAIAHHAKFTDALPLASYDRILHLVPRLVNVVTLAEAIPVPGTGLKLPLDLHAIGSRCSNSYYAPRRFAAVQLAFDSPRCRVLIFHTGRLVGTGCSGPMAARLSIMRAARQLAVEAGVFIHVRNFQVINQVGAVSIDARLDCDGFASTHSATSHYDRQSFVGLAWRPKGESICCEMSVSSRAPPTACASGDRVWLPSCAQLLDGRAHSAPERTATRASSDARRAVAGRANLPGSTRERDMLGSFARMLPELLRHSDRPDVRELIADDLKAAHRPAAVQRDDAPEAAAAPPPLGGAVAAALGATDLWADEEEEGLPAFDVAHGGGGCDDDEALLDGAGF